MVHSSASCRCPSLFRRQGRRRLPSGAAPCIAWYRRSSGLLKHESTDASFSELRSPTARIPAASLPPIYGASVAISELPWIHGALPRGGALKGRRRLASAVQHPLIPCVFVACVKTCMLKSNICSSTSAPCSALTKTRYVRICKHSGTADQQRTAVQNTCGHQLASLTEITLHSESET